ncbi:helix-turn-helix domain-containing protein [Nocardiopsis sp. CNT312]|uniref:helix-turn-helix domain-containing protein n=1 Tax=Nocardiopsis sp. CNT312 TaxID=1137268 RepID=UPI0004918882|nr:helix-turn-helix domain-containing protein [Nocardiopsis sp. CNT312]
MNEASEKRPRVSGEERTALGAELRRRYEAGESIRMLSAATGRSYGFVRTVLEEAGVELRGRGGGGVSRRRGTIVE